MIIRNHLLVFLPYFIIIKYLYIYIPLQLPMNSFHTNALKIVPKIICIGKNYLKHVKQMGGEAIPESQVIFLKPWSSISYNPKQLKLAMAGKHQIDHELQLGVWISKGGSSISKEQARHHIGGYFIAIDFTDRDFQKIAKTKGLPWSLAKGQDNFCPISDLIQGEIDPYSVQLEMKVNGKTRQKEITGNMHYKIEEIIEYTSGLMTLSQGDLILTGTPDGVGPVVSGDHVEATARIGENVVAELNFKVI